MDGRFIGDAADFFLLAAAFVGEAGSIEWAVDLSESDETGSAAQTSKTVAWGRRNSGRPAVDYRRATPELSAYLNSARAWCRVMGEFMRGTGRSCDGGRIDRGIDLRVDSSLLKVPCYR